MFSDDDLDGQEEPFKGICNALLQQSRTIDHLKKKHKHEDYFLSGFPDLKREGKLAVSAEGDICQCCLFRHITVKEIDEDGNGFAYGMKTAGGGTLRQVLLDDIVEEVE